MNNYESAILNWEPVIGLEIHVQLLTNTKMFSSCDWGYGKSPNTLTCPLTMAYPGTLPVVNKKAVENAIMIGKALNCKINNYSEFSRKHYFYPDLPKGYQISQYDKPICGIGYLDIDDNSKVSRINITRAHLEEDAGKLIHTENNISLVDYNRSGAPLIEIVTEPDFRNPELVDVFLKTLKNRIQYIGVSDCDMEKGNLRVDLNVSIMKKGSSELGVRREVKNLNSFRSVNKAIKYEIQEQARILESGSTIKQSTMIWNEAENKAKVIREKEDAHDYRYFPEPDLAPLLISDSDINRILENMPELPDELSLRLKQRYHLDNKDVDFLISDKNIASYYEETLTYIDDSILVFNWLRVNIMQIINREKIQIENFTVTPLRLSQILILLKESKITKENAIQVFEIMIKDDSSPDDIVKKLNLGVLTNQDDLNDIINKVFKDHSEELKRLHSGEDKLKKFFMGKVMKETKGKYPPTLIIETLNKVLN